MSPGGKAPLTWRNLGAVLHPGLALSASGVISGTTTNAQEVALTAVVTDANGQEAHRALTLTVRETGSTFTVGHWNLEWFGAPNQGPPDSTSPGGPTDDLQIAYARDIIRESGANVWGLVEMVDAADFATLKSQIPGYQGFLANDTSYMPNGPAYYSTASRNRASSTTAAPSPSRTRSSSSPRMTRTSAAARRCVWTSRRAPAAWTRNWSSSTST